MDNMTPQEIFDIMNANSPKAQKREGISEQAKAYLRQQLEQVTKELELEQRELKRLAALEKRKASKVKANEQEKTA